MLIANILKSGFYVYFEAVLMILQVLRVFLKSSMCFGASWMRVYSNPLKKRWKHVCKNCEWGSFRVRYRKALNGLERNNEKMSDALNDHAQFYLTNQSL